jgi:hypothetical protein
VTAIIAWARAIMEYIRMSWRALMGEFGFYEDD